jgi:hypothetical protein
MTRQAGQSFTAHLVLCLIWVEDKLFFSLGGGYIIYLFDSLLSNKAFAKLIISGICKKLNLFTGSWKLRLHL